ncbi:DUF397 domain-containing protein [Streptomyces sp. NBC_00647]|uniref:DUF397 domain-containing protein n=2 Tax=Streptomyces TaxID=1883 RepID=UPI00386B7C4C
MSCPLFLLRSFLMDKIPSPPLTWLKSSASGGGNCVEVAASSDVLHVRDSKVPAGSVLTFPDHSWQAFLNGLR